MSKRIVLGIMILYSCLALLHAELVKLNSGTNLAKVISSTSTETILEYNLSQYQKESIIINGTAHNVVRLPGEGCLQEKGKPDLPNFNRSIIIPDRAGVSLSVLQSRYIDLTLTIAPSKGVIYRNTDPANVPYTFDQVYKKDAFYPEQIVSLSEPFILRDWRGITVQTIPMQYNPVSNTLRVYTHFQLKLSYEGLDSRNELLNPRRNILGSYDDIYRNFFINYYPERYISVDEFGKLLVICPTTWMTAIAPYVSWKKQKGISTELIDLATIGTTGSQVMTYIQNRYNADPDIAYVQLVGDAGTMPTIDNAGGSSDPTFALVAGADSYPDIFVGRFSCETEAQLQTQVNRSIAYERDLTTSATWLSKATGIASNEGDSGADNGETDQAHSETIRSNLLTYGYTPVDQIYQANGATIAQISTAVNQGRGLINYIGHGSQTSWGTTGFSNTNVAALTNDNMLPLIVSVACTNGQFSGITCFAETWMRSVRSSTGNPIGSIAFWGSSINQSWNPPMRAQDEVNHLMVNEQKKTVGSLLYNGACKMIDVYGTNGANMYKTWIIFGDASLQYRTKTPQAMTVTYPAQIYIGQTSITVNTGVSGALVCLSGNNINYGSGYTGTNGAVTLSLSGLPATPANLTLTATAFNKVTFIGTSQLTTAPPIPQVPVAPVRMVAEFEPAKGALIRYPLGIPFSLVKELAEDNKLYTIVANASTQSSAVAYYQANGVNLNNCEFILAATDSYWTRDYGPWFIFDGNNNAKIVDVVYNRPRPNDDAIPAQVGQYFNTGVYNMSLNHTGGNIMSDGAGVAASTNLILTENPTLTQQQINTQMSTYLGVTDYQLFSDPNNTYIQHIDCWAKLLDVDKVLIRSVPPSNSQYSAIEAMAAAYATKISSYGTPYRVYRVYTSNEEPYTNSFILNKKILVPQKGTANDAAALAVYRAAMPGYEVIGSLAGSNTWLSTDAIHCRVNSIPDPQMLHIKHTRLTNLNTHQRRTIEAEISHHYNLLADSVIVYWKTHWNHSWNAGNLSLQTGDNWQTTLPEFQYGDSLYYYISAKDTSGRVVRAPLCGASDPFRLNITSSTELDITLTIEPQTGSVNLTWNPVPWANSYKIYSSGWIEGGFGLEAISYQNSWSQPIDANAPCKYYRVVGSSD